MAAHTFELSEMQRRKALALGESGARWLAGLGDLVADLEQRWQVNAGRSLGGGTEALVLAAVRVGGVPVVLKIGPPGPASLANEARVLQLAHGAGYVTMFAHDETRNAMMLERLGEQLVNVGLPVREQIELLCQTLRRSWRKLDAPNGLMTGAEKARSLAEFITETWDALDKPCEAAIVDQALAFAAVRERAYDPQSCILVHGDSHPSNALLRLGRPGLPPQFKFVDPDGLFCEPAYDLGISMREWSDELLAGDILRLGRARCKLLHDLTGEDETAIWQWGFIERVSTGLLLWQLGFRTDAVQHFAIVEAWMAAPDS